MKLVDPGPWYRLPPTPSAHSRHCPATFNPFLEDDEDESKDEEVQNEDQIQLRIMWPAGPHKTALKSLFILNSTRFNIHILSYIDIDNKPCNEM